MPKATIADQRFEEIEVSGESGVLTVVLNRPERMNALTFPMLDEMKSALAEASQDPAIRALVIRGAGRSFCAGDNVKGMGDLDESVDRLERYTEHGYFSVVHALRDLPKPVIAVVQGHALGAGCELAMAADIRLVHADAKIGIPFVKLALAGGTYQLPRLVGLTRAAELLFSGRPMDGHEALAAGWATEVHDNEAELEKAVSRWADSLRAAPTKAIGLMKQALYHCYQDELADGIRRSALNSLVTADSHDRTEGRAAWTERRPPAFRGY